MRRLDKDILQDIERDRNDDWCIEDSKGYEEDSRRSEYSNNGDGRSYFMGKHQQSNNKYYQHIRNIGRLEISGSKWYRRLSVLSPKDVGW